jgi:hypothetical protein
MYPNKLKTTMTDYSDGGGVLLISDSPRYPYCFVPGRLLLYVGTKQKSYNMCVLENTYRNQNKTKRTVYFHWGVSESNELWWYGGSR